MDPRAYAAAIQVCCWFRGTERVLRILRRFEVDSNGTDRALFRWVWDVCPEMTIDQLWVLMQQDLQITEQK